MVKWELVYARQAVKKDARKISAAGLKEKVIELLRIVESDPFQVPPPDEKLMGDLTGAYSRRINIQHRMVYQVFKRERVVKIIRLWTRYE